MKTTYEKNPMYLKMAAGGDESAVERLIENNYSLVAGIARRFSGRGCETEDLIQIGMIGMLKAIRSFDTERGTAFSTYAVPLIMGEIRRFLRDDGLIKVSRIHKRNAAVLMRAHEKFVTEHGREPQLSELAEMSEMTEEAAAEALESAAPVHSLSASLGDDENFTLEATASFSENPMEGALESIALREAIGKMPPLWRQIVILRYYRDKSQQETARILKLTQVKVSREEKKIFEALRESLSG